jgi:hypothetical protein
MGQQIKELEETINSTPADLVLIGTAHRREPCAETEGARHSGALRTAEIGSPDLTDVLSAFTTGETDHGQPNTSETTPREHALASAK